MIHREPSGVFVVALEGDECRTRFIFGHGKSNEKEEEENDHQEKEENRGDKEAREKKGQAWRDGVHLSSNWEKKDCSYAEQGRSPCAGGHQCAIGASCETQSRPVTSTPRSPNPPETATKNPSQKNAKQQNLGRQKSKRSQKKSCRFQEKNCRGQEQTRFFFTSVPKKKIGESQSGDSPSGDWPQWWNFQ